MKLGILVYGAVRLRRDSCVRDKLSGAGKPFVPIIITIVVKFYFSLWNPIILIIWTIHTPPKESIITSQPAYVFAKHLNRLSPKIGWLLSEGMVCWIKAEFPLVLFKQTPTYGQLSFEPPARPFSTKECVCWGHGGTERNFFANFLFPCSV